MEEIRNKVAESGIVSLDLAEFLHGKEREVIDIAPLLWQGLAIKEKDFRNWMAETDWTKYAGKYVSVYCSAEAIIPTWVWLLLSSSLSAHAKKVFFGTENDLIESIILQSITEIGDEHYLNARVVVKGCSEYSLSPAVYIALTAKLVPQVKSLMFGEPCSTVPVFKKK